NARDHGVVPRYRAALVAHGEGARLDPHVTTQRIEHAHAVATLTRGFDQAPGGIQLAVAREDRELHRRSGKNEKRRPGNAGPPWTGAGDGNRTHAISLGS